jgi:hypothetical protein
MFHEGGNKFENEVCDYEVIEKANEFDDMVDVDKSFKIIKVH